jgi:bifunctional oligoribonuclease and PAP phosphatase NrnA
LAETLPELLRERDRFLLSGHENPDGDCVGAQAALFHLLRALGKQAVILNPDPLARSFDFLLRHTPFESYRNDVQLPPHDVVVLLDCSQLSRLGNLGPKLRATNPTVAVIDHHVGSDHGDGSVNFVDSNAPSTGAMVHRLYGMMGVPLSAAAAEGVFLTLVSDTGWFRHSNTSPDVLSLSAEMARQGVDISGMFDLLYRRMHQDSVAVMGQALAQASFRLKGRYGVVVMDRHLMERAGRAGFDPDLVMEPVRSVEGIEVVAMFKERLDGVVKLSLRATRDVDVQLIAAHFGGGGHRKAAGATLRVSMAEAVRQVEALVAAALPAAGGGGR